MRLGIELLPNEPIHKMRELVLQAEALGYEHAWIGDSQCIWREATLTLGACAVGTCRIVLGSAVTNVSTRHLAVVAGTSVTLHEFTGGRAALGLGVGDSAVRTLGRSPVLRRELETAVACLRALFAGGEAVDPGSGQLYRLSYGVPAPVPIYIAANAPKMLQLAGRLADGVIMLPGVGYRQLSWALGLVAEGAQGAGRDPRKLDIVLSVPTAVDWDGERARLRVKTHVARALMRVLPPELDDPELVEIATRIRTAYDYSRHLDIQAEHAGLVPDSVIRQYALAGTPDECAEQLREIASSGIDEVAVIPYVDVGESRAPVIETIAGIAPR